MSFPILLETSIPDFPTHRGKVRDVLDIDEHTLLVVATDRLSAFDVVFPQPIPDKGFVLTQLSIWWFRRTGALVPNHFITANVDEYPESLHPYRGQIEGRSMLVRKAAPLKGEFVVRGYLDGSAWKSYEFNKQVCGIELLAGLRRRSSFGAPIFTPTTKASVGHDMPVDFGELCRIVGKAEAEKAREHTLALYTYAHNYCFGRGLILSDTKFEFGMLTDGEMILIDEVLTPDSSRFWTADTYAPEFRDPISLDKQYIRDYVESIGWNKQAPAPVLPREVIERTTERYRRAYEAITGFPLPPPPTA